MPALASTTRAQRAIAISVLLAIVVSFILSSNEKLPVRLHLHDGVFSSLLPTPHSCPSPRDVGRPAITRKGQNCINVPSKNDAFQLEVCFGSQTCNEFTFRTKRTNFTSCEESEATPDPSNDPELSKWIKDNRGPDAFLVRTDGAERFATVSDTYEGNCSYAFDIRLKNPGPVYLQTWWTFTNYQAYSDTDSTWPEQHLSLIDSPIWLDICPSDCVATTPARLLSNATVVPITSHSLNTNTEVSLPACSGSAPIRGTYLPSHPLDVLYPPFILPQGNNYPVMGRYYFTPESCQWKHAGTRLSTRLEKCTNKKHKVLFVGDSHGRVAWDSMIHRLSGHQTTLTLSRKMGSKNVTLGESDFTFLWDPRGKLLNAPTTCDEMIQDSDIVLVSVAAHLAASRQVATSEYISTLGSILSTISKCPLPTHVTERRLVYMTAPAAVPRTDEYVRKYADRRTNVRLQHWRDLGVDIALKAGWSVVDQFELTLPHNLEPLHTDMAHYLATDAIDPIVDEVIGKLGICDGDEDDSGVDRERPEKTQLVQDSRWNADQKINQLPNEILHEIFEHVLADGSHLGYMGRPTTYFTRQQGLRRISSHWNQIITSSPYFWNTLCCTDVTRRRFKIALNKSRNVGLHIFCRTSNHCRRFVNQVADESHRWITLHTIHNDFWDSKFPLSIPKLNTLRINSPDLDLPELPQEHGPALSLTLFGGSEFDWDVPITRLRTLELTRVKPPPSVDKILEIVAASSALERLVLADMGIGSLSEPRRVEAPNLRYLGFPTLATDEDYLKLAECLILPPTAVINIRIFVKDSVVMGKVVVMLFQYACKRVQLLDETFSVGIRTESSIILECPPKNPIVKVQCAWSTSTHPMEEGLRDIGVSLRPLFQESRELRFAPDDTSNREEWKTSKVLENFGRVLHELSNLTIPSAPWALDVLASRWDDGLWLYPALLHLRLHQGEWRPELMKVVEARFRAQGVLEIGKLALEGVGLCPGGNLEMLRTMINDVIVE
ncbi:hypothetical protein FRB90_006815 [Tulasnella sp. 427]|nr:hypothetical protein FRB90_006815 [Tulasnella sp. 427]